MSLLERIFSFFKTDESSNRDSEEVIQTANNDNLNLEFPELETVTENGGVSFAVKVNGNSKPCIITIEVLQDFFGLRDGNSVEIFRQNRFEIQNAAERIIRDDPDQDRFFLNTTNFPAS